MRAEGGTERRRWYARPWRLLYGIVLALGHEPKSRAHHLWRDFVPALAIIGLGLLYIGLQDKVDQNSVDARVAKSEALTAKRFAQTQIDGRRAAVDVTCGALRGVQDAGRMVLTDTLPGTEPLPTSPLMRRLRAARARAYNRVITDRIVKEAGASGRKVIRRNGSVNCDALRKVGRTERP